MNISKSFIKDVVQAMEKYGFSAGGGGGDVFKFKLVYVDSYSYDILWEDKTIRIEYDDVDAEHYPANNVKEEYNLFIAELKQALNDNKTINASVGGEFDTYHNIMFVDNTSWVALYYRPHKDVSVKLHIY